MNGYSALIVDDELNNVAILEHFVNHYCLNVKVIGHATKLVEAVQSINAQKPDILLLDIRLNDGDAFDILDQLEHKQVQVIFVTSYDEYAIKAFKYNAVDYVLKPVVGEEIVLAVSKAVKNIEQQQYFDFHKMILMGATRPAASEPGDYIAISTIDKVDLIRTSDIVYMEADNKYTVFRTKEGKKYTSNKNLLHFEQSLDKMRFFRIHHSYMINIDHMLKMIKRDGNYCEMDTGILLPISKRKLEDFNRFLKL